MKDKDQASEIECDFIEVEKALEGIAGKEVAVEDTVENDKGKADNPKAVEMRERELQKAWAEHSKCNAMKRRRM